MARSDLIREVREDFPEEDIKMRSGGRVAIKVKKGDSEVRTLCL